jgi:putative cardiolipin synthase
MPARGGKGEPVNVFRASVAVIACVLAGCATLPPPQSQQPSAALTDSADTRLGRALDAPTADHPGRSGIHALPDPRDAFATRLLLAAAADRSIDLQYYIWHADTAGWLMLEAVWNAAERGVRVRLLLDDLTTRGMDGVLATLDAHPMIEVRYYNPLVPRGFRFLNFVSEFERANRRMHNKSLTVDNQVTVVGGRNIGNEYFAAGDGAAFVDLDVAAVGPAVAAVSHEFDRYWNSRSAYPAAQFPSPGIGEDALRARFAAARADDAAVAYLETLRTTPIVRDLLERRLPLEWTTAQVVADDPAKTVDADARADLLLFPELVRLIGAPAASFDLITPYFVPGEAGAADLEALARTGVRVRILTNALAASDVSVVHAGYAKRRVQLLRAGVRLYELKPTATSEARRDPAASSSSALHAKTFAVDGARVFVGSLNFDPRSARLNTEMGFVIDSRALAGRIAEAFDGPIQRAAYEVRLAPDGERLQWIERTPAGTVVHDDEPGTGWWQRFKIDVLQHLPIEHLL